MPTGLQESRSRLRDRLRAGWTWIRNNPGRAAVRISIVAAILLVIGIVCFLQPWTWRYYTDGISVARRARDVTPDLVAWAPVQPLEINSEHAARQPNPAISPDGSLMVIVANSKHKDRDLWLSRWDGQGWGEPAPMRALNSRFNETTPCFSRDGQVLYFATDRPGSLGNYDIWAARWDGIQFAWPLPLTHMVNSPFDDVDPSPSASGDTLFFASNRPNRPLSDRERGLSAAKLRQRSSGDFDIFFANHIPTGTTNREVERATSMLYYLREGALADPKVMGLLGGTPESEAAVSKTLAWLARTQEEDGHWNIQKYGGAAQHDVGCTAFALLVFLGRGQRHDQDCEYRDTVQRALDWLIATQDPLTGDMRGRGDMYDHGIGALALAEAYGVTKHEDLVLPAQTAIEFIVKAQNKQRGGWRYKPGSADVDLSVSGWMIMALKSAELSGLRVPPEALDGARRWMTEVSGGRQGGLYGYQNGGGNKPAMTATGYFCWQLLGLSPNTLKAFETSEYIQDKNRQRMVRDAYFCYYATLCSYQNQGPLWRNWQRVIQEALPQSQHVDGYWQPAGGHANRMGKVVYSALMALSLQAHYRYTPMYGLGFEPDPDLKPRSANLDALVEMPLYRRAKRLAAVNSRSDDRQPCSTRHGDFIYFASDRPGGEGGYDIYRSRISDGVPVAPVTLGPAINSAKDDTGPALTHHGFQLIFGSTRDSGKAAPRLYSATSIRVFEDALPEDQVPRLVLWTGPEPLSGRFNVPSDATDPCFSPDGTTMVFARTPQDGSGFDLYRATWTGREWTNMAPVKGVNLPDANEISPSFNHSGTHLVFASDRPGGQGGYDIWSARWKDGRCAHIKCLGDDINTPANERDPAFSADDLRLFFSSDRPMDDRKRRKRDYNIFLATRAEAGTPFDRVVRLDPLCSKGNDLQPEPTPRGDLLYFASDRKGAVGGTDIYCARLTNEVAAAPWNMTRQINSTFDDPAPALKAEGFELAFNANQRLRTTIMREVHEDLDLTRLHQLVMLIERIKWWILAVIGAALLLLYLLRHWRDFTSLFQKCLVGSAIAHLLLLLLMAGIFIATEVTETSKAVTMEVAIDADALAQEKMALEMEENVVELAHTDVDVLVEQAKPDMEVPEFTPEALSPDQPIVTETSEDAFAAKATASRAAEKLAANPQETRLELAKLPEIQLPEVDFKMEEAAAEPPPPEPEKTEPTLPEFEQQVTVAFSEQAPAPAPPPEPSTEPVPEIKPVTPVESRPAPAAMTARVTESRETAARAIASSLAMDPFAGLEALKPPEIAMAMETPEAYKETDPEAQQVDPATPAEAMPVKFTELASAITSEPIPTPELTDRVASNLLQATFMAVASELHTTATESQQHSADASRTTAQTLDQLAKLAAAFRALAPTPTMETPDRYAPTRPGTDVDVAHARQHLDRPTASTFASPTQPLRADPADRPTTSAAGSVLHRPSDAQRPSKPVSTPAESLPERASLAPSQLAGRFAPLAPPLPSPTRPSPTLETPSAYREATDAFITVSMTQQASAQAAFVRAARLSSSAPAATHTPVMPGKTTTESTHHAAAPATTAESRRERMALAASSIGESFSPLAPALPGPTRPSPTLETPSGYRESTRRDIAVAVARQSTASAAFTEVARLSAPATAVAMQTSTQSLRPTPSRTRSTRLLTAATTARTAPRTTRPLRDTELAAQFSGQAPPDLDIRPTPSLETPVRYKAAATGTGSSTPTIGPAKISTAFQQPTRITGPASPARRPARRPVDLQVHHESVRATGGSIVAATAGLESPSVPPRLTGAGQQLSLMVASAIKSPRLKVNAPGKLDVPSGSGAILAPTVLRKPGTLSTEVIEGLGGSDTTQRSIASALTWFCKTQERDGRWDIAKHGGEKGHNVAATSLVLLCYYGWGATHLEEGPHQEHVKKALAWLLGQMEKNEAGELTGRLTGEEGNLYDHAIATIALCEAYALSRDEALRAPARRALDYIIAAQNPDTGGWRYEPKEDSDILVTGWQILALKSGRMAGLDVDQAVLNRANRWIDACAVSADSGLYSYQPGYKHRSGTMIATGMFSRQLAGVPPTDSRMQKSAAHLHTHPFKAQGLDVYYLYYGTLALYQHQGPKWHTWNERMKEILPGLQCKGLFKAGSWDPSGHLAPKMGRLVTTAMCTLSLEVYYRILPMYGFRDDIEE